MLADGIYPDWPIFMKTIPMPVGEKQKVFAKVQEGVRKDVERAFGRLHSKYHILKFPGQAHKVEHLSAIWGCCIILHNMTLRDQQTVRIERTMVTEYPASLAFTELRNAQPLRDAAYFAAHSVVAIIAKRKVMENRGMCELKQRALVEHVYKHSKKKSTT